MRAELIFVGHIKTPYQTTEAWPWASQNPKTGQVQLSLNEKYPLGKSTGLKIGQIMSKVPEWV